MCSGEVLLPSDVGALYLDVKGDLSVNWAGNITKTKGAFELGGMLDGSWEPEYLSNVFKLHDPEVRLFLTQECNVNCTVDLKRLYLASEEISLSQGESFKVGLLNNEFNISRFTPTSHVETQSTLLLKMRNSTNPLLLKMTSEWEGKNREFLYDGVMLQPWTPMGTDMVTVNKGYLKFNMTLTGNPTRISKAHIDGLVSARFADMPVNTTLRILANIQAPGLKNACSVLKDLPIPSVGALFDAMGLEVVKDIITLDGNMEAGYIDVEGIDDD